MASADSRDELTCSICLNIYTDPVSLTCGHKFCRLCIGGALDTQGARRHSCPECRKEFRIKPDLKRTLIESNIAESFHSAHQANKRIGIACTYCIQSPVPATKICLLCEASLCEQHLRIHSKLGEHVLCEPITSLENKKCSVYKEILNYYCCEDTTCIFVSCSLAREHKGHEVETLNEASGKKNEKMRNILERLISEREEPENRVLSLHEIKRQVQSKAVGVREQVITLIRDIREQLEALEKRVLSEISRQEEHVSLRDSDLIRQLKVKKEELPSKMGHAEELCNLMDPVTVLNGLESGRAEYCDTEEEDEDPGRDDIKVYDVGDLDVSLISVVLHSGLAGIVARVTRRHHVPESSDMLLGVNSASDILLDVNTAGYNVSVSDDLKNVSWSEISQNHPETSERFQDYPQVLSSRGFSSGHHYWEVEGSESGIWGVGMAYRSIDRRESQSLIGFNNKSWGLQRWWFNNHYYVIHNSKIVLLPHTPCCERLGIFLDYEAGRLSFYELCDPIKHLHTFTATFTEPLHAGFGVYVANSWVRM